MNFSLYSSIIDQLRQPEIIRLNYSGESTSHPSLLDAIRLAHQTGAFTELVTALASYPEERIPTLVTSGLDRLTVSLHTMDDEQFSRVYRFSSLEVMRAKLRTLIECQRRLRVQKPIADFAFVAMHENLGQLNSVAEYAQTLGIKNISVHPVIRRAGIPAQFGLELVGNRLQPTFKRDLADAIREAVRNFPGVEISSSTAELQPDCPLDSRPRRHTGPLPNGAWISTCDQNPWETVHILANGDVVPCEVQDQMVLGNLNMQPLASIWHGEAYQTFRDRYQVGQITPCQTCPYKLAYYPSALASSISAKDGNNSQLLGGWYQTEGEILWSKQRSAAVLAGGTGKRHLYIKGILPSFPDSDGVRLSIWCNDRTVATIANHSSEQRGFELSVRLPETAPLFYIRFATDRPYRPSAYGFDDVRELSFALSHIEVK